MPVTDAVPGPSAPLRVERFGSTVRFTFAGPSGGTEVLTVTMGEARARLLFARLGPSGALLGATARSWLRQAPPPLLADEFASRVAEFLHGLRDDAAVCP